MIDIHSHILFGVDDGARDLEESVKMLEAAKEAGFDTIIATPHIRRAHFDKKKIKENMAVLRPEAEKFGIKLLQGYEYNIVALADDTIEGAMKFCTEGTNTILLEMNGTQVASNWERIVVHFQREGADIIIAHPERYKNIFENSSMVDRMLEVGCKFQVDLAVMLERKVFNKGRKSAKRLLEKGVVRWCASDAHCAEDYKSFAQAFEKYGSDIFCQAGMDSYPELAKQNDEKGNYYEKSL